MIVNEDRDAFLRSLAKDGFFVLRDAEYVNWNEVIAFLLWKILVYYSNYEAEKLHKGR